MRKTSWPKIEYFGVVFAFETLHTFGLAFLFYVVLPQLDTLRAGMVVNGALLIPSILLIFKSIDEDSFSKQMKYTFIALDGKSKFCLYSSNRIGDLIFFSDIHFLKLKIYK